MNAWSILLVLFLARLTMGFQFQAVAALSPDFVAGFGIGLAELGLLVGLYVTPGVVIAIPGGAIGQHFGETRVVIISMAMMVVGGVLMASVPVWEVQLFARLLAGTGGVVLNVIMAKLVTDWFAGGSLATAMAIYTNSWPLGIGLALVVLPPVSSAYGLSAAMWVMPALCSLGLILFWRGYRQPSRLKAAPAPSFRLERRAMAGVVSTGMIWGLFNGGLVIVFAFGPALLVERGWSEDGASARTSFVLWAIAIFSPIGGAISDRSGRPDMVVYTGLGAFALLMLITPYVAAPVLCYIAIGAAVGLVPGVIMSMPSAHLTDSNRAYGIGIFFALYYVGICTSPIIIGAIAEARGTTAAAFNSGAVMVAAAMIFVLINQRLRAGPQATKPA
ncbi:MAG: MFS transporter [Pseudomonadota bacterium]